MSSPESPAPPGGMSPLKRAFLALEAAEARVAELEQAARAPVAIVGLSCRVPGADDPEAFWRLLEDGHDTVGPTPSDRWDGDAYYDANPETPGRIAARRAGFLRGPVDRFDAGLFGIAPREAQGMDPQQRLLLEVSWEALENAGKAPDRLERSSTGVYVGLAGSDYANLALKTHDPTLLDAHFTSGIAHSIASGRLSYLLGLQGPSVTLDTACSSSLVAVHLACQALRSGDCTMALAGGVNLMLAPDLYIALSRARMLSPEGRCKTFDAAADGFARGEGCGVVVLKLLKDAQADGDRVLAVIRGSAVNQDGPSGSLTAPNGPAQEAVIRQAIARAGLTPRDVGVIEAHGTGTELGDPLEVQALGAVFGDGRDPERPVWLASVKTNIGHLEAAAGVVGLIKLVLSLRHRRVPQHLHFRNPSPHIPWADLPFRVPTALAPWEPIAGRRVGGVSSFGFSGTNAHLVVEEAPADDRPAAPQGEPHLLVLSARDEAGLRDVARRYATALATRPDADLADVCFTAAVGRSRLSCRATVLARTMSDLAERLTALAEGRPAEGVSATRSVPRDPPRVAFLFTGQGAQYAGMARDLHERAPVFRAALDRVAALLAPRLARPLLEVLFPAPGAATPLDETGYTQPALFAVEYALAELWRSWGVTPNAVIGHSVGEFAAAVVAGVLTLEDATRLVAERGRLMQSLPPGGTMAAVMAPEARVAEAVAPHAARVAVAAVNAPEQTVVSGGAAEVEAVCKALGAQGVRCKPLVVSHAFHSPLVDPVLAAFEREVAAVKLSPPRLPLVSNLTGKPVEAAQITQPTYWRRHVREAVRFGEGLTALAALRPGVAVEIGPNPTLLGFARAVYGESGPALVPSLKKGRADAETILEAVAALFLAGADVDLRAVMHAPSRRVVDLPTYPFQRERFWFRARAITAAPGRATGHPLLGTRLRSAGSETVYEAAIGADAPSFVRHHRVQDRVIVPATAYLEALLAAAERALASEHVSVGDVAVGEALILEDDGTPRTMQVVCGPSRDGAVPVSLCSAASGDDEKWTVHVTAQLRTAAAPPANGPSLADLKARCPQQVTPAEHYAGFQRRGLDFGLGFQVLRELWRGEREALGVVELSEAMASEASAYRVHPVLLDGCLQTLAAALAHEGEETLFLPIGVGAYTRYGDPGTRCTSHVTVQAGSGETRRAEVRLFDGHGRLLADLRDVQLKRVSRDALARIGDRWLDDCLYETAWRELPPPAANANPAAAVPLEDLAGACAGALPRLRKDADIEAYDAFLPRLEALCADYTVRALTRLGWSPAVGERVTESALAERLGIAARHRRLFGRLLDILAETRWLERGRGSENDGFTVVRPLQGVDPVRDLEELSRKHPAGLSELEMTGRTGGEMAEALRGEREPMQLLFPGGSLSTAERLYRDSPTARFYNGLVAEALAALAAARSEGRPLRVLEIGGGTGGTTAHVLPRLPSQGVEYTFTDVGPLFVARARERFAAYPFLRFGVLDLEKDPQPQGFGEGAYDVVIASNVIHATARLKRTLAAVRRLLAPGGLLSMLEVTAPQRWFDLTVGLTEGWWAFDDVELRTNYATMPREKWLPLLAECGFEGVVTLPEGQGLTGSLSLQSLFLARAGGAPRTRREWLVLADRGGFAATLAARLTARGDHCTIVDPGSSDDHRRRLHDLKTAGHPPDGVIHAASLDSPAWENTNGGELAASVSRGVLDALRLAQALVAESPPPRLWILTRGGQQADALDRALDPAQAPAWGLGKTVRREHPEIGCVCVDVEPADATALDALVAELAAPAGEGEVALRRGGRRVARLVRSQRPRASQATESPFRLVPATRGSLDAFTRAPLERRPPGPGEVEVRAGVTGLNFKDVLNVLGMYPGNPGPLGGECAGTVMAVGPGVTHVKPGDEVMAVAGGSFASHVIARSELVARRPPGVTAEEGAAFPIAFLTAAFCLDHLAKMRAGDRVLVHAAAGGVGLAAVRLAQRAGAEVFATAGSPWKRDLLRSLGVPHVLDSRSASFADEIDAVTGGRGVDVVLNSLTGDLIDASFRVLAQGGRFVEIGKRGIKDHAWVQALGRGHEYFIVDWGETAEREPDLIGALLARLVEELRDGKLAPLPRHVFALDEASRAFRFMAQARHAGRIVLRHGAPSPTSVRRDGTYLVTGGLSGLGPVVASWLVERGAGRVVLVGRRAITPEVSASLQPLRNRGADIVAASVDAGDESSLRPLLDRLRREGPPLRGIIHSAGVLDDAALLQQDTEKFARVFAPKVQGGFLLDKLTRGDALDFFVLFSSAAAVLGSPGQANHSAANAFLDLLARERASRGLPGLSIDWGAWTEVGAAADRGITDRLAAQGLGALTPEQGRKALERAMGDGAAQVAVLPVDWRRYLSQAGGSPFFSELASGAAGPSGSAKAESAARRTSDLREKLAAEPRGRWHPMVAAFVRERALGALGLDATRAVDPETPLGDLGLDSLLAVELRNTLSGALARPMPASLLFDYPTLNALTGYLLKDVLGAGEEAPSPASAPKAANLVGDIEELSDDEVERQLAALAGSSAR